MDIERLATLVMQPGTPTEDIGEHLPMLAESPLPAARKAVVINTLFQDPRRVVRMMAATMAETMGDDSTIRLLQRLLDERNASEVLVALAELTGSTSGHIIARFIGDAEPNMRIDAAAAAARLPDSEGIEILTRAFASERDRLAKHAIAGYLADMGRSEGADILMERIEDQDDGHFAFSLCAMCKLDNQEALRKLQRILKRPFDVNDITRYSLCMALRRTLRLSPRYFADCFAGRHERIFAEATVWVNSKLGHEGKDLEQ